MTYELFYSTGGHGGPYPDIETAVRRAVQMLRGSRTERSIAVHTRTAQAVGGFGPQVARVFKAYNFDSTGALHIEPPMVIEPENPAFSPDWFVSAVRVELKTKIDALQRELLSLRPVGTHTSIERCAVVRGEISGLMQAETVVIDVMRQRT